MTKVINSPCAASRALAQCRLMPVLPEKREAGEGASGRRLEQLRRD